jgi:hypothetical protein
MTILNSGTVQKAIVSIILQVVYMTGHVNLWACGIIMGSWKGAGNLPSLK